MTRAETPRDGRPLAGPPVQPYEYRRRELVEPDWRRFPGWRDVPAEHWRDPQWQRAHCVKNVRQLRAVLGDRVGAAFYADLARDQERAATMAMLLPPHLLNTMVVDAPPDTDALYADPVRRYMLPVFSDRHPTWPSHPYATRDSLHEAEMWACEGLTHRYPTKVLAEVVSTCPQYCGHCTRMDLVGPSTAQVDKYRFALRPADRYDRMLGHLRADPGIRDVVVSGGDVANMPWPRLEAFVSRLLDIDHIRDIRLASKALAGLPQHWLAAEVRAGMARLARTAFDRGVRLAVHTHVNAAQQVTPLVAEAARAMLEAGVHEVRNQGVLLRGVNGTPHALLDLCFALLDGARVTPYYFYLCDLVPGCEHWRLALWEAQDLQDAIMGYLPGFATPRLVCDVPYAGKRWVHQVDSYDRELGISYWTKPFRTVLDGDDPAAADRRYEYYDPIHTLPAAGREFWRSGSLAGAMSGAASCG
ncbi:KamA family radical SAM protein [Planosporangium sp. 12N6]|uniref:KamA family radical SAM protein n=1 Tax=Planosporangium spinosum TaxID=3402278 RepID=UPI003CF04627